MKLIKNSGDDRVVDALRSSLAALSTLDVASPAFSAFAYGELRELLGKIAKCRIVLPDDTAGDLSLLGSSSDRPFRNRLQARWLARQCHQWVETLAEVRSLPGIMPQSTLIAGRLDSSLTRVINGNCAFTAEACARFDRATRDGENMAETQKRLGAAIASILGKKQERAVASLFTPGGTHAKKGEFQGINDFEVVAFLVVLPEAEAG